MRYDETYWEDADRAIRSIPNVSALSGKSVLITGATGMICSSIAEILFRLNLRKANITIYLAGRSRERMETRFQDFDPEADYTFVPYDATRNCRIDVPADYIIHGASHANPAIYAKQPVETMLANLIGLNSLLESALRTKAKRVLYISSSEVYGKKGGSDPYHEEDYGSLDILNPRACYPSAKRAAETLCVSYGSEYGLETVIARPGHIYGPTITRSDSRASAQFTWDAVEGRNIVMKSAGAQLRSYCYTLDCASAILTGLINGKSGSAYNISNKNSVVTIRTLAEAMARYAGVNIAFSDPTDAERKSYNLMDNSSLTSDRLEALGWTAAFDLQMGVKRTIDYLRETH